MAFTHSVSVLNLNMCPRLLEKHNALRLPFSTSFSLPQLFRNIGELGAKIYFKDHEIANKV